MYFIVKSKQRWKLNAIKMNCILLLIKTKNFVKNSITQYKVRRILLFQNIFRLEKNQIMYEKYDKQKKLTLQKKIFHSIHMQQANKLKRSYKTQINL